MDFSHYSAFLLSDRCRWMYEGEEGGWEEWIGSWCEHRREDSGVVGGRRFPPPGSWRAPLCTPLSLPWRLSLGCRHFLLFLLHSLPYLVLTAAVMPASGAADDADSYPGDTSGERWWVGGTSPIPSTVVVIKTKAEKKSYRGEQPQSEGLLCCKSTTFI